MVEFSEGKFFLCRELFLTKKLCEPNGVQHPILRPQSVPYVHQHFRILHLQKRILFKTDIFRSVTYVTDFLFKIIYITDIT